MAQVTIRTEGTSLAGLQMENFATEDTLSTILKLLQKFTSDMQLGTAEQKTTTKTFHEQLKAALTGKSSTSTTGKGKDANKVVDDFIGTVSKVFKPFAFLTQGLNETTTEFLEFWAVTKLVTFGLEGLAAVGKFAIKAIDGVVNSFTNLTSTFVEGKTEFKDYFNAIGKGVASIPLIGKFFESLIRGVDTLTNWSHQLQELNSIGAGFGNNLVDFMVSARNAGLSVEDYSKVIKSNIENFATFGSIISGVKTYTAVANISMKEYSGRINAMGMSLQEYNEELPAVLGIFAGSMKLSGASNQVLAASALDLVTEFNALSELTGKSRKQQEDELKKAQEAAGIQLKLATMGPAQIAAYNKQLAELNALHPGMSKLNSLLLLGMPALSKEMMVQQAAYGNATGIVSGDMRRLVENGASSAEISSRLPLLMQRYQSGMESGTNSLKTVFEATAGGLSADIMVPLEENARDTMNVQKKGLVQALADVEAKEKLSKRTELNDKNLQENLLTFNTTMTKFQQDWSLKVLGPLLNVIAPHLKGLGDFIIRTVSNFSSIVKFAFKHWEAVMVTAGLVTVGVIAGITLTIRHFWEKIMGVDSALGMLITIIRAKAAELAAAGKGGGMSIPAEERAGKYNPYTGEYTYMAEPVEEKVAAKSRFGKFGGKAVRGIGMGVVGMGLGFAGDALRDSGHKTAGAWTNLGSDAAEGAMWGALIPGLGETGVSELVGAGIGLTIGLVKNWSDLWGEQHEEQKEQQKAHHEDNAEAQDDLLSVQQQHLDVNIEQLMVMKQLNDHMSKTSRGVGQLVTLGQ